MTLLVDKKKWNHVFLGSCFQARHFRCAIKFGLILSILGSAFTPFAHAQRPSAPRLLPEDTLAYIRVENVPELVERFGDTAMGRITSDEQVKPFVGHLYQSAIEAFSQIEDRVGLSLGELLEIPQGELCIAVVAPDDGRPEFVLLADVGDHIVLVEKLLARLDEELAAQGATRSLEKVGETEIVVNVMPARRRRLTYFERDEVVVMATNTDLAKQLLTVWDGGGEFRTMADNRSFTSIMSRCNGFRDERPQITWYVNPLEFIRRAGRGNLSAQAGLLTLSTLGIDGLQAVGGSIILATEEFDGIFHAHVLLKNPRKGVLKMVALDSGDTTPEPWVPEDAASYTTFHWELGETYSELTRLYDLFYIEGAWQDRIAARLTERLGVDLERDLVDAFAGRASMVTWIEKPARLNSQATLIGLKLNDSERFRRTLQQVAERLGDRVSKESHGNTTYYRMDTRRQRQLDEEIARRQEPCAAVLGDYLVLTDSVKFLKQVIFTKNDASQSLANELDFKLIANKIQRQLGDVRAGLVSFDRPEEGFRLMYELAVSPITRSRLAAQREQNPLFNALYSALQDHPLPPFAVLAQYLAPGGAILTNDETGFHYTAFTLRRN